MRLDGSEQRDGGVCVQFVLLTHSATFNILLHKLDEAWPPELSGDELVGLEVPRVSGSFMVVTLGKDGAMEGVLQRNIDMTL